MFREKEQEGKSKVYFLSSFPKQKILLELPPLYLYFHNFISYSNTNYVKYTNIFHILKNKIWYLV